MTAVLESHSIGITGVAGGTYPGAVMGIAVCGASVGMLLYTSSPWRRVWRRTFGISSR